jgi:anthranilate synthase/aminodeoxychorismate synthase-like glutamine amidotransferase
LIDNYDSFTFNLVQVMAGQGADVRVFRNDQVTVEQIVDMKPDGLVVSPGPCTPKEAGISMAVIRRFSGVVPVLGVCLGHQSIGAAFGATVSNAKRIMHGKTSMVTHDKSEIYRGMKNPFPAGRYHSLAVLRETLPPELLPNATSEDGEIMGMRHRDHPTFGVQFHPESVLTPGGKRLLRNFLQIVETHSGNPQTTPAGDAL